MPVMVVIIGIIVRPKVHFALGIATEAFIANGVRAPIVVVFFPGTKTVQAIAAQRQPEIAGSQKVILVTYKTDVFRAVPNIKGRHSNIHREPCVRHRWQGHWNRYRGDGLGSRLSRRRRAIGLSRQHRHRYDACCRDAKSPRCTGDFIHNLRAL